MRDAALLRRLARHSVPLSLAPVLTDGAAPLRHALLHPVWGQSHPTFLCHTPNGQGAAFVQYAISNDKTQAALLWAGGAPELLGRATTGETIGYDEAVWLPLLEQAVGQLARRGVQSVVAEAAEDGPEHELLRRAGYANYARQDLWRLSAARWRELRRPGLTENPMIPFRPTHDWDVALLYAHLAPPLIRLVEPQPPHGRDSWLHYEKNDLAAYAHMKTGKQGYWLRLFFNTSLEMDAATLLRGVLAYKEPMHDRPLYCAVRNYQERLNAPLQALGFEPCGSQVVLVKHTVQHVRRPLVTLEQVLQANTSAAPTTQIVHQHQGRRRAERAAPPHVPVGGPIDRLPAERRPA